MTKEEIEHLAELSKLEFSEQELVKFEKEFDSILKFVSQVKQANIEDEIIIPKVTLSELRADEVRPSLQRDEVLKNAPRSDGECFIVPQVVE